MTYSCGYCKKEFTNERILITHMCAIKQRYKDKDTWVSRYGHKLYNRFYKLCTPTSPKEKTFDDFAQSKYYIAFVKLARYIQEIKPIDKDRYADWLFMNNVKEKKWCDDKTYEKYVIDLLQKETVDRALERSIAQMDEWATENETNFTQFFYEVPPPLAVDMIRYGKISPWVLYLADSADALWERLNTEQGEIISESIDPKVWRKKFETKLNDRQYAKQLLDEAGL